MSISLKLFETTHIWGHRMYYQKLAGQKTSMKSLPYFDERIGIERNKRNNIEETGFAIQSIPQKAVGI